MRRSAYSITPLFSFLSAAVHTLVGGWSPCCRFTPSCSHYAADAFSRFGFFKGLYLTTRRLIRCRPGAAWGVDPVPPVGPSLELYR